MSCADARSLLHAYLDGELDLVRHLDVERHLQGCPDCAALHAGQVDLRAALVRSELYAPAPEGLKERLQASLRRVGASFASPRRCLHRQIQPAPTRIKFAPTGIGLAPIRARELAPTSAVPY